MASSLFTHQLIEKKKRLLCPQNRKKMQHLHVSPVSVAFAKDENYRKNILKESKYVVFLNLSFITLPLICLD